MLEGESSGQTDKTADEFSTDDGEEVDGQEVVTDEKKTIREKGSPSLSELAGQTTDTCISYSKYCRGVSEHSFSCLVQFPQ